MFTKATKSQAKLRLALFGASGSGKTFTALRLAKGIGGKVALIDSENHTASKYADRFEFDTCALQRKTIDEYIDAMHAAAKAGYNILIIDSGSHAWQELLQEVDDLAQARYKGNTWSAWSQGTPKQKQFVGAIQTFPGHLIMTMRAKTEWSSEDDGRGKKKPVRIGLAPEQGKGIEYEFDILFQISPEHTVEVLKDRTGKYQDQLIKMPGEELGAELAAWLSEGTPAPVREVAPAPAPASAAQPYTLEDERERLFAAVEAWTGIQRSNRSDFVAAMQAIAETCRVPAEQQRTMAGYQAMRAFVQRNAANNRDFIAATEREAQRAEATRAASDQPAPTEPTKAPESPAAQAGAVDQGETKAAQWPIDVPADSAEADKPGTWTTRVTVTGAQVVDKGTSAGRNWTLTRVETDVGPFATFSTSFAALVGKEVAIVWCVERSRRTIKNHALVPVEDECPF
jgi:hypothetical protein